MLRQALAVYQRIGSPRAPELAHELREPDARTPGWEPGSNEFSG